MKLVRSTTFCSSCHTVDGCCTAPNHEPVAQRGAHRRRLCLSEQRIGCAWSAQCSTGCCGSRGRRGFKEYHLPRRPGGARESSAGWQNDAPGSRVELPASGFRDGGTQPDVTECRRQSSDQRPSGKRTRLQRSARRRATPLFNYLSLECKNDSCNEPTRLVTGVSYCNG